MPKILKKYRQIKLAYLFGSYAGGEPGPSSDIDIALLLSSDLTPADECRIAKDIESELPINKVDIVILNGATPILKYEVVSSGVIIYQNLSDDQLNSFESAAYKEFFDTEYQRRIQYEYLKKEVA